MNDFIELPDDAASPGNGEPFSEHPWPVWRRKLSKDEINAAELASYPGRIRLVRNPGLLNEAVQTLRRERVLGFDTETRPSFRPGVVYKPALLQLGGRDSVFLFRLADLGLPPELRDLLADPGIVKAGVAVNRDVRDLQALEWFEPAGFVDLGECGRKAGIQHHGLRGMAAVMLNCRISKGARTTNWDRPDLPEHALRYAATDAWIAWKLYRALEDHGCPLPAMNLTQRMKSGSLNPPEGEGV